MLSAHIVNMASSNLMWPQVQMSTQRNNDTISIGPVTQGAIDGTTILVPYLYPDSKVHGAHMGPTWGRQDPGGSHVGHVNLAIWVS